MTERGMTRFVGLYTLALGTAFTAAPSHSSKFFGMGERSRLMLYFGLRDLALVPGLLRAQRRRPWLLARALADASDAGILVGVLISGGYAPRLLPLLAAAVGSSALALGLAEGSRGR
ncbi:MAG: hypothetical protein M3Q29_01445 [Chloroflexota bacterium]|nr:hypothetical protein [Chloroflexota bacterium]